MEDNKVVYLHKRESDHKVFYVGEGGKDRPKRKSRKNQAWEDEVAKHGYYSEMILGEISKDEAESIEIGLIEYFGIDNLVNESPGGGKHSEKTKARQSKGNLGKKRTPETKAKLSKVHIGNSHRSRKVVDTSTGIIYASIKEAAPMFPGKHQSISQQLLGMRKRRPWNTLQYIDEV